MFQCGRAITIRPLPLGDALYPCTHMYLNDTSWVAARANARSLKQQPLSSSFCRSGQPSENRRSPASESPTKPNSIYRMFLLFSPMYARPTSDKPPGLRYRANLLSLVHPLSRARTPLSRGSSVILSSLSSKTSRKSQRFLLKVPMHSRAAFEMSNTYTARYSNSKHPSATAESPLCETIPCSSSSPCSSSPRSILSLRSFLHV